MRFGPAALVLVLSACVNHGASAPNGPSLYGLVAHPGVGRIDVTYTTEYPTADELLGPPPIPVDRVEITLIDERGSEVRRVTSTRLGSDVAITFDDLTDGQAYTVEARALSAQGAAGRARRAYTITGTAPRWELLRRGAYVGGFAPDGRLVLITSDPLPSPSPDLITVDLLTRTETPLTHYRAAGDDHGIDAAIWSSDGSQIAYVYTASSRSGAYDPGIYVMDVGGGVPPSALHSFGQHFLQPFSVRDGVVDLLVFPFDANGASWQRLHLDGTLETVREYPALGRPDHPALSPDGRLVVYDVYENYEHVLALEDVSSHVITARFAAVGADARGAYGFSFPRWDPTSRRIVVGTERGGSAGWAWSHELWVLDLDTGRWRPLTGFSGELSLGFVWGMDWSPDGTTIAVSDGGNVYLVYP